MLPTVKLSEVNKNLICPLCKGYLIDACTIVECLHSFCKSCIVRFLETSHDCPVCHTEVHKTKPLVNVRPDPTLQDIVYKIVPGLYENERQCRKLFQASVDFNEGRKCAQGHYTEEGIANIVDNSDAVYVTLDHHQRNVLKSNQRKVFPTRYLRCSRKVPVRVLKKLIEMKFEVKKTYEVEISRCDEILNEHLTLRDIARIYGLHGKTGPIDLKFDIMSKTPKNDDDEVGSQQSLNVSFLNHSNFSTITKNLQPPTVVKSNTSNLRSHSSSSSTSRPPETS